MSGTEYEIWEVECLSWVLLGAQVAYDTRDGVPLILDHVFGEHVTEAFNGKSVITDWILEKRKESHGMEW